VNLIVPVVASFSSWLVRHGAIVWKISHTTCLIIHHVSLVISHCHQGPSRCFTSIFGSSLSVTFHPLVGLPLLNPLCLRQLSCSFSLGCQLLGLLVGFLSVLICWASYFKFSLTYLIPQSRSRATSSLFCSIFNYMALGPVGAGVTLGEGEFPGPRMETRACNYLTLGVLFSSC
jgi:putative flippase GtrA